MKYWDTSAVCKLYLPELDSDWYLEQFADVVTADLTDIELYSTLLREEHAERVPVGHASSSLRAFRAFKKLQDVPSVPMDSEVIVECERIAARAHAFAPRILIRSLDLIHVASASVAKAEAVVTADKRMRALAARLGFKVLPEIQ